MARNPKFRPEIRRIKLNPEQAVLTCSCYNNGRIFNENNYWHTSPPTCASNVCHMFGTKDTGDVCYCRASGASLAEYSVVNSSSSS